MNTPRASSLSAFRFVVALLCGTAALGAQQLAVSESVSRVEVLLSDREWRRAVLGRAVPDGGVVTTWLDSEVTLSRPGTELRLGSLGHLVVETTTEGALELRLTAGALQVEAIDIAVRITLARGDTITTTGARFLVDGDTIAVETGTVQVDGARTPEPITLSGGAEFSFVPHRPEPILPITPAHQLSGWLSPRREIPFNR